MFCFCFLIFKEMKCRNKIELEQLPQILGGESLRLPIQLRLKHLHELSGEHPPSENEVNCKALETKINCSNVSSRITNQIAKWPVLLKMCCYVQYQGWKGRTARAEKYRKFQMAQIKPSLLS